MRKSQVSVEMMFAISLILMFFLFVVLFSEREQRYIDDLSSYLEERRTCTRLAGAITKAFFMGDGSTIELSIGRNANLSFTERYVQMPEKEANKCYTPVVYEKEGKIQLDREQKVRIENANNKITVKNI